MLLFRSGWVRAAMAGMVGEPEILRLGKLFGRVVAVEYTDGMADARPGVEVPVARGSGHVRWRNEGGVISRIDQGTPSTRPGRVDILIELEDDSGLPAFVVVETKRTDWSRQRADRVRPNARRHARQVWQYLEPLVDRVDRGEIACVQAALLYPRRPAADRTRLLEHVLGSGEVPGEGYGITVVWWEDIARKPSRSG